MIALLLASALAAVPARTVPNADGVLFIPRLEKAKPILDWLARAGTRAPLLRPSTWRADLTPLLGLDLADPASLTAAGIDTAGAATFSFRGDERIGCFTLKAPQLFEARVKQSLQGMGDPWKSKDKGASLVGAAVGSRVVGGYALKGKEACTVSTPVSASPLLKETANAFGKSPSGKAWTQVSRLNGMAMVVTPRGVAALKAEGDQAMAEGWVERVPGIVLGAATPSPYAALSRGGLFFSRFRMGGLPEQAEAYRKRNLRPCRFCDQATNDALFPLAAAVASRATGNAVVRVEQFVLKGSLRSEAAQYFALKNAFVVELTDPTEIRKALAALTLGTKTDLGVAIAQPQGALHLGLSGKHFFAASDLAVATQLLEQLKSEPQAMVHAAEWSIDPSRVTQAFSQVSLLDVVGSRELAGLFAVGTELGPLFGESQLVSGTADKDGESYRWTATWQLKPARAP